MWYQWNILYLLHLQWYYFHTTYLIAIIVISFPSSQDAVAIFVHKIDKYINNTTVRGRTGNTTITNHEKMKSVLLATIAFEEFVLQFADFHLSESVPVVNSTTEKIGEYFLLRNQCVVSWIDKLIGWTDGQTEIDWLIDRQIHWLTDGPMDRLIDWLIDWQTYVPTDWLTDRQ